MSALTVQAILHHRGQRAFTAFQAHFKNCVVINFIFDQLTRINKRAASAQMSHGGGKPKGSCFGASKILSDFNQPWLIDTFSKNLGKKLLPQVLDVLYILQIEITIENKVKYKYIFSVNTLYN